MKNAGYFTEGGKIFKTFGKTGGPGFAGAAAGGRNAWCRSWIPLEFTMIVWKREKDGKEYLTLFNIKEHY